MNYKNYVEIVRKEIGECVEHIVEQDCGSDTRFNGNFGGFAEKGDVYDVYRFTLIVDERAVQVYARMPALADSHRAEALEYISRANSGLTFGAFEMNFDDGEVTFHVSMPSYVLEHQPDMAIPFLLVCGVNMVHKYSQGYLKVLDGDLTPAEAVAITEALIEAAEED